MKRLVLLFLLLALPAQSAAKETVDLMSFEAPVGWTKEEKPLTYVVYTLINKRKGSYCRIFVMLSMASTGSLAGDFDKEWKNLIVELYKPAAAPEITGPKAIGDWQAKTGTAPYTFGGKASTAQLTTMTGNGKTMSIVAIRTSEEFVPAIKKLMDSVELKQAAAADAPSVASATPAAALPAGSTRFDDGWTSTAQDDWVLTTKGSIRMLIHYPNKAADAYDADLLRSLKTAWNVLVAPKYGPMNNLAFRPLSGYQPIEYAEADATEKATGKTVHVVLFKKHSDGGKYLEFITPDKKTFEQEFGAWHEGSEGWGKLEGMTYYNKFAINADTLQGKWTNQFGAAIQYVNAYTGFDAGMNTHSSTENFQFGPGAAYKWDLAAASGMVGNIKFQSVKSSGKFTVDNDWKVTFSDIEGKPRSFNAHFSRIKGLRVLWLDGKPYAKAD